jgi:hypothetical protein
MKIFGLVITTKARIKEKETHDVLAGYNTGVQIGLEKGFENGYNYIISHSRDLTEDEFKSLIKYLKDHNMIISYSKTGVAVRVDINKDTRPYRTERITGITFILPNP